MVDIADMARASTLAIDNAPPFLIGNTNDHKMGSWAIEPVKEFIWPKALLSAVKGHVINDFMCCVWVSGYPMEAYSELRRMFRFVYGATEVLTNQHMGIWRTPITIFSLYEVVPFPDRMVIFNTLASRFFRTPIGLDVLIITESTAIDSASTFEGKLVLLWESTLRWKERSSPMGSNFRTQHQADIQSMIPKLRADSVSDTSFYQDWFARTKAL